MPISGKWRVRSRWFLAETFVVLVGVMIALAFQAWYQARENRERERAYLEQVVTELRVTEAELEKEIAYSTTLIEGAKRAHAAFFITPTPSLDSLTQWFRFDHADPEPTLGTLRAVTSTGDLRVIRSDSVRATIVWISERARYYDERLRRWENVMVRAEESLSGLRARFAMRELENLRALEASGTLHKSSARSSEMLQVMPGDAHAPRFLGTIADYLNDSAAYSAVRMYMGGNIAHANNMQRLLDDIRSARQKIESHAARSR